MILSIKTRRLTAWIISALFAINTSLSVANNNLIRTDGNGVQAWNFSAQEAVKNLSATVYRYVGEEEDAENFRFPGATIVTLVKDDQLVAIGGLSTHIWGEEYPDPDTQLPSVAGEWILSQEDYLYSSPVEWEEALQGDNSLWEREAIANLGVHSNFNWQSGDVFNNSFTNSAQMANLNYSFESYHHDGMGTGNPLEGLVPIGQEHHTTAGFGLGVAISTIGAKIASKKVLAVGTFVLGVLEYNNIKKEYVEIAKRNVAVAERNAAVAERNARTAEGELVIKWIMAGIELEKLREKAQKGGGTSPGKKDDDDDDDEDDKDDKDDDGGSEENKSYNPNPNPMCVFSSNGITFVVDKSQCYPPSRDPCNDPNYDGIGCDEPERYDDPYRERPPECFPYADGAVDDNDNSNCYNPGHGDPSYNHFIMATELQEIERKRPYHAKY